MKLSIYDTGWLRLDVQTDEHLANRGTSAHNLFVKDAALGTEVYFGRLHACVRMPDHQVEVLLDPEPYDALSWKNAAFARERAWDAVMAALTPERLMFLLDSARQAGARVGAAAAKAEIRRALGLFQGALE